MRNGALLLTLLSLAGAIDSRSQSLPDIVGALRQMPGYASEVNYAVTLPQAEDDIVYTVSLLQPDGTDSYLIQWATEAPSGPVEGFTAWFDGHFYDFRNRRLRELHEQWDDLNNVQNSAQFSSLLPSRMADRLAELDSDAYTYTIRANGGSVTVDARRLASGEVDAELRWVFDARDFTPQKFYADYNPGAIASQQVSATYTPRSPQLTALNEEGLRTLYPDAFDLYRESQFAIESMRNQPLPAFSLPKLGGGRLTRREGDPLERPTLIVLLDTDASTAPEVIAAVRRAVERMPADARIIWACTEKNPDALGELLGDPGPGETALLGARPLMRSCGASSLPSMLSVATDGRVTDVIIGMNNHLESDVMQSLTLTQKNL